MNFDNDGQLNSVLIQKPCNMFLFPRLTFLFDLGLCGSLSDRWGAGPDLR